MSYGKGEYWDFARGTLTVKKTISERTWTKATVMQGGVWENTRMATHTVKISDGVTIINQKAFSHCIGLSSLSIPSSVTSIGESAFNGCHSLESVAVPDGVTRIENKTFRNCLSLESVTIPAGVTHIGSEAFKGCVNLTDVYYGGSQSQWQQISIDLGNEALTKAAIHCNS